jgi:diacylglycerol kinase (ATP)
MRSWLSRTVLSFRWAFEGWAYVLRTQRNAWFHALASLAVIGLALWLRLPGRDWAILILTMGFVWAAEFANTALEAVVDLIQPEQHPTAKVAKDVSAAMVLLAAISSVIVGLLLLGLPLWERIF